MTKRPDVDPHDLMKPSEVAEVFSVDAKTVTRWANAGKLSVTRTLGNQRRYYRDEVMELRRQSEEHRNEE